MSVFGFLSSVFEGDKAKAPPVHPDSEHPAPAPTATPLPTLSGTGTVTASGGLLDSFHPITAMKSLFGKAESFAEGVVEKGVEVYEHHEAVKAAEASRDQLHDQIDKLGANLTKDQKDRILARTKGLSGDDLIKEMGTIENALKGKNADRALATYAELDEMIAKHPEAKDRLNSDTMGMLVTGVASSRTDSDRGQAGILGARQARDSAEALIDMNPDEFAKTQKLLNEAGKDPSGNPAPGADPAAEQALILKAVASRRDDFKHGLIIDTINQVAAGTGVVTPNAKANTDIDQFAKDIRGMKRDDLIQNTTLIDIDDKNTSTTDPDDNKASDTKTDNDGLFQRFDTTCGPTTSQMVRGESDPIYALKLRQNHFNDNDPNSEFAQEQKKVLEANGGVGVSRLGDNARTDTNNQLNAMVGSKEISGDQFTAVKQLINGGALGPEDQKKANAALDVLRKKNAGHPTDAELTAMKTDAGKTGAGMVLDPALNAIAAPGTHIDYQGKGIAGGSISNSEMGNVDTLLKDGQDVPIRIAGAGNGGHFMMVSDVRGEPGKDRKYLVSDPWSGATRWVPESDLQSGNFTTKEFQLGQAGITHLYGDKTQSF
ncbi:MAG: hypothetical protein ACM31C_19605 [Acidobacteriota bacterium]